MVMLTNTERVAAMVEELAQGRTRLCPARLFAVDGVEGLVLPQPHGTQHKRPARNLYAIRTVNQLTRQT
jgi:hypothetical protein